MIRNVRLKVFLMRTVFASLGGINRILPKNRKKILLYANEGFRDNTRYLFDYMIRHGYQKKYRITIASDDVKELKKHPVPGVTYRGVVGGIPEFLRSGAVYYCFGKLPIEPSGGQKVIQMWHGTSFKGFDKSLQATEALGKQYYTHVFASSEYFRPIVMKKFGCPDDRIFICGHPRTDVFYEEPADYRLPKHAKTVIWLPTFRKSSRMGYADTKQKSLLPVFENGDLAELDRFLAELDIGLIVKLHPLQDAERIPEGFRNLRIMKQKDFEKAGYDLYRLLPLTDALITDYSSVFYDYLLLDRPIGFTEDDKKEYGKNRGFAVDNPDAMRPGMRIGNREQFYDFLRAVSDGRDEYAAKRKKINDLANRYQDGRNSLRALLAGGITE